MKASDLREFISFNSIETGKNHTGEIAELKTYVTYSCRAAIKRTAPVFDKDGVDAREIYKGATVIFIVRNHEKIEDKLRVRHNNKMYEIILIEKRLEDNTLYIHTRKINE